MMKWDIDSAYLHLNKDKKLKKVIKATGLLEASHEKDLFTSLLSAIVSQQLSTKAASTIWNRFILLFPNEQATENAILKMDIEILRAVGLSYQKAGYLKNIASFSLEKSLEYKKLYRKSDEDLIEYLCEIKGVGRWTAEMILMFNLNRPDILPVDDLGIQQAMISLYELELKGKELKAEMHRISLNWQPYRTLASRHLWKWKDSLI